MGINDLATSPGTWCIKGTYESLIRYKDKKKKFDVSSILFDKTNEKRASIIHAFSLWWINNSYCTIYLQASPSLTFKFPLYITTVTTLLYTNCYYAMQYYYYIHYVMLFKLDAVIQWYALLSVYSMLCYFMYELSSTLDLTCQNQTYYFVLWPITDIKYGTNCFIIFQNAKMRVKSSIDTKQSTFVELFGNWT